MQLIIFAMLKIQTSLLTTTLFRISFEYFIYSIDNVQHWNLSEFNKILYYNHYFVNINFSEVFVIL